MYKYLWPLLCLILMAPWMVQAQQVVSSGGSFFQNAQATMTITVGETVISSFTKANAILTQGFNQALLAPELQLVNANENLACEDLLVFPTVVPGTSSSLQLIIRNDGNGPLSVDALNLSGDPVFLIDPSPSLPLILQAEQTQRLNLSFQATGSDAYLGTIEIINSDTDEGNCRVNLSASAVIVDIPAIPSSLLVLFAFGILFITIRGVHRL